MFCIDKFRKSVLNVTIHPVQTGQYDGQPNARHYQICLPNFWPGMHSEHSILLLIHFLLALSVSIAGEGGTLPQTSLMDSFNEYTKDSWTYDGRYRIFFQTSCFLHATMFI